MSDKYCPHCKSKKPLWKAGKAWTREGSKQLYKCSECNRITYKPKEK
jgi:transposase-like protein